jgi:hypothetical protein
LKPWKQLTDEHIVPFGLGGRQKLREASCKVCQDITSKIETYCIEHLISHAREDLGIYGRRANRKTRRATAKRKATFIAIFRYAGIGLFGHVPSTLGATLCIQRTTPDFDRRLAEQGAHTVNFRHGGYNAETFGRMLATIAHAYAVMHLGIGGFSPIAVNFIKGLAPRETFNYLVGGEPSIAPRVAERHALAHRWQSIAGKDYLVVDVRLFANLAMPLNHVVVGVRP